MIEHIFSFSPFFRFHWTKINEVQLLFIHIVYCFGLVAFTSKPKFEFYAISTIFLRLLLLLLCFARATHVHKWLLESLNTDKGKKCISEIHGLRKWLLFFICRLTGTQYPIKWNINQRNAQITFANKVSWPAYNKIIVRSFLSATSNGFPCEWCKLW